MTVISENWLAVCKHKAHNNSLAGTASSSAQQQNKGLSPPAVLLSLQGVVVLPRALHGWIKALSKGVARVRT
jgi:hypothetical protein